MNIQYTGHHTDVTAALKEFTNKKFTRLDSFSDYITKIQVTFSIAHLEQIAEANISVPGQTIHAKSESHDLYTAIDLLIDKLVRQLKKYKEKHSVRR